MGTYLPLRTFLCTSRRRSTRRKGGAVAILRLNDLPPTGPGFLNSLIRIWGRRT